MGIDIPATDLLLTTTRSVRKRLDFERSVDVKIIEQCIEIALQAPTGSNQQQWHFYTFYHIQGFSNIYQLNIIRKFNHF